MTKNINQEFQSNIQTISQSSNIIYLSGVDKHSHSDRQFPSSNRISMAGNSSVDITKDDATTVNIYSISKLSLDPHTDHAAIDETSTDDSLTVSYQSQSDFDNHMLDSLIATGNVFAALKLANEINELNGYDVINDYHVRYVKDYFLKGSERDSYATGNDFSEIKVANEESDILKIKNEKTESRNSKNKTSMNQKTESKMQDLQKAYMKMLSK